MTTQHTVPTIMSEGWWGEVMFPDPKIGAFWKDLESWWGLSSGSFHHRGDTAIASNTTKDSGQESEGWMKSLPSLHQHSNLLPEPPIGQTYLESRGEEILSLTIQNTVEDGAKIDLGAKRNLKLTGEARL